MPKYFCLFFVVGGWVLPFIQILKNNSNSTREKYEILLFLLLYEYVVTLFLYEADSLSLAGG